MMVVADSSPFVLLVTIRHVEVLRVLFGQVVVPRQVAAELTNPKRPELVRAFMAKPPEWLEVRPPDTVEPIAGLHAREVESIALARKLGADALIIDERQWRRAATDRGLRVVGTIGILELAAWNGLVDLEQTFEAVNGTDFWVSSRFLDERLALFRRRTRPWKTWRR